MTTATLGPIVNTTTFHSKLSLPPQPARLLIADDEHLVAAGLRNSLSEIGFSAALLAADGEQAVELCRMHKPDMVLLDIRMPKMDGLTAAEVIFRQMNIPAIILSAYSDPEYVAAAARVGVFGYLLKPITQDQLRVTINIAWSRFLGHVDQSEEIAALKQRREDRKLIEQAKWVIVQRKGVSEPEAMKALQMQARSTRRTLVDVARSIIESEQLFNAAPGNISAPGAGA